MSDDRSCAYEAFAEACDGARTSEAAGRIFLHAAQECGFAYAAIATHGASEDLGALSVLVHNWPAGARFALERSWTRTRNPLFEASESTDEIVDWTSAAFRADLDLNQGAGLRQLSDQGLDQGVIQRIRGAIVPASCLIAPAHPKSPYLARVLRMAVYAFHHIIALQKPKLDQSDLLTAREYDILMLAIRDGLRPAEVAQTLGVSINTVRTMRQSAMARLGARNQEEVVWRMVETGQLFLAGRPRRRGEGS